MTLKAFQYFKELQWPLFIILVFLLTGIFLGQTLYFEFVYDDFPYLVANRNLQNNINPISYILNPSLGWAGTDSTQVYRPLSAWLYAVELKLFGFDPLYYHLVKISTHALNTILAAIFLFLLFKNKIFAMTAGLFFFVHPVNTEAVVWISQQNTLVATVFVLGALIFFLLYGEYRLKIFFFLSLILGIIAPFFKEQLIVTPFFVLGCLLYLKMPWQRSFLLGASYFLTMTPFLWIRYSIGLPFNQAGGWFNSMHEAILTMTHGLAYYIQLIFIPYPLTINYEWFPVEDHISKTVILSTAIIAFCVFLAIYFYKKVPEVTIGVYWFFVGLIPVNNIVTPIYTYINERYLYLSSLGMIVAFIYLVKYYLKESWMSERWKKASMGVVCIVLFSVFSYMTFIRLPDWENQKSLWRSTLRVDYNNLRNFTNYSTALQKENSYREALIILKSALRIPDLPDEGYSGTYRALVSAALRFNDTTTARSYLIEGLTRYPNNAGLKLLEIKYYFARNNYKKAAEISRSFTDDFDATKIGKEAAFYEIPFYHLIATKMLGDGARVAVLVNQAPSESARETLNRIIDARALMLQGDNEKALSVLYPTLVGGEMYWLEPYMWLGQLYEFKGDYANAVSVYQVALFKNPTSIDAVIGFERARKKLEEE